MSDALAAGAVPEPEPQAPEPVVVQATAGSLLREAREAAGLHIAALAVNLKVPVKKLEALEADRFDLLPDVVFVRALAASVCRTLRMDPQAVLDKLPGAKEPRLVGDSSGINAPFRAPSDNQGPGLKDQLTRPAMLVVLALLLGAVVLLFLPDTLPFRSVSLTGKEAEPAVMAAVQTVPSVTASTPAVAVAEVPPAVAAVASAAPSVLVPASSTIAVAVAPPLPPVATASSAKAATPASGIVEFQASGESWIDVTDAKGQVTLRRLLVAGDVAYAGGALPLTVTVGRSSVTTVSVRGKAFDLNPVSKDNVARFEVK